MFWVSRLVRPVTFDINCHGKIDTLISRDGNLWVMFYSVFFEIFDQYWVFCLEMLSTFTVGQLNTFNLQCIGSFHELIVSSFIY